MLSQFYSTQRPCLYIIPLLNLCICHVLAQKLTVAFPILASQVGESILMQCSTSNPKNKTRYWIPGDHVNATKPFQEDASQRVYANNTEGTLTFTTTWLNDTGTYTCFTSNGEKASLELHVYIKLTYFKEGMIILGIDLGLVVVLIGCGLYTFIKSRLKAKRNQQEAAKKTKLPSESV